VTLTAPSGTKLVGNCAEWIVEAPTVGGSQSALAEHRSHSEWRKWRQHQHDFGWERGVGGGSDHADRRAVPVRRRASLARRT
jgi:hypothetical protein